MIAARPLLTTTKSGVRTPRVAELDSGQRQHGEGVLVWGLPLEVYEDLIDGKLGLAAEYEAVLGGITLFGALAPRLVAGCLSGGPGCLVAPVGCDSGQSRGGLLCRTSGWVDENRLVGLAATRQRRLRSGGALGIPAASARGDQG